MRMHVRDFLPRHNVENSDDAISSTHGDFLLGIDCNRPHVLGRAIK